MFRCPSQHVRHCSWLHEQYRVRILIALQLSCDVGWREPNDCDRVCLFSSPLGHRVAPRARVGLIRVSNICDETALKCMRLCGRIVEGAA